MSRAIPIGFAFNWLKKSIEIFWPIIKRCNQLELEAKSGTRFVANQKAFSNPNEMVSHSVNCSFQQDVESYDPILNPVLNRELRRTGGRVLITIGDQDIDLSPSFTIFLSTRDPTVGEILGFLPFENNTSKIWKGL